MLGRHQSALSHVNDDFNHSRSKMGRDTFQSVHFGGTPHPWVGRRRVLTQRNGVHSLIQVSPLSTVQFPLA